MIIIDITKILKTIIEAVRAITPRKWIYTSAIFAFIILIFYPLWYISHTHKNNDLIYANKFAEINIGLKLIAIELNDFLLTPEISKKYKEEYFFNSLSKTIETLKVTYLDVENFTTIKTNLAIAENSLDSISHTIKSENENYNDLQQSIKKLKNRINDVSISLANLNGVNLAEPPRTSEDLNATALSAFFNGGLLILALFSAMAAFIGFVYSITRKVLYSELQAKIEHEKNKLKEYATDSAILRSVENMTYIGWYSYKIFELRIPRLAAGIEQNPEEKMSILLDSDHSIFYKSNDDIIRQIIGSSEHIHDYFQCLDQLEQSIKLSEGALEQINIILNKADIVHETKEKAEKAALFIYCNLAFYYAEYYRFKIDINSGPDSTLKNKALGYFSHSKSLSVMDQLKVDNYKNGIWCDLRESQLHTYYYTCKDELTRSSSERNLFLSDVKEMLSYAIKTDDKKRSAKYQHKWSILMPHLLKRKRR
jgi:hypothetical protein